MCCFESRSSPRWDPHGFLVLKVALNPNKTLCNLTQLLYISFNMYYFNFTINYYFTLLKQLSQICIDLCINCTKYIYIFKKKIHKAEFCLTKFFYFDFLFIYSFFNRYLNIKTKQSLENLKQK